MVNRKRPFGSSGVLAALLIAPRSFAYYICSGCMRTLFYTYAGETCPFDDCGALVTAEFYVEGYMPDARGREIDFRAGEHEPRSGGRAARRPVGRGARRGGRRRPAANAADSAG